MSNWRKSSLSILNIAEYARTKREESKHAVATPGNGASSNEATVLAVSPEAAEARAKEAAVPEQWEVGERILKLYEVKEELGEGGMGKVYRVHHMGWKIDLAVKTPRSKNLSPELKESFVREAETWVNLDLPPS